MNQNNIQELENDNRQCFVYIRVSTAHQTGGLESQLHAIQNFCKQNEISHYRIFQDENISGAKSSRPALDAMMTDVRENKCKMLIVFSFSRFSRSCTHLLQSLEVLKKHKVQFVSVSEKIDTNSPIGSALLAIIGALAQLERDLIRERILSGLERAKKNGVRLGRLKTRPSDLIRKLYMARIPYKEIARVCKCSEGAVGVEARLLKIELGEDKVKEIRRNSNRRPVLAYKPEVNYALRFWMAKSPQLTSKILGIVIRAIDGYYKKTSQKCNTVKDSETGTVTLIQRFGSSLNVNVHFHILALDGVYGIKDNKPRFYKSPQPKEEDLQMLLQRISTRIDRYLLRNGYLKQNEGKRESFEDCIAGSVLYMSAWGRSTPRAMSFLRLAEKNEITNKPKLCVQWNGYSLHAATEIKAHQRWKLERLLNYILRPPVAVDRLTLQNDGNVSYKLKKAWSDGTTHIKMTQMELIEKLAALVPPPRMHMARYHGVFGPHSKLRPMISKSRKKVKEEEEKKCNHEKGSLKNSSFAKLLKRVFLIDIEICPHCKGKRKIIGAILKEDTIKKILSHMGLNPIPPPISPPRYQQESWEF